MDKTLPELIREVVAELHPDHDTDWTAAGLPDVKRVRELASDPSITRADIEAACPGVTRSSVSETANAQEEFTPGPATETEAGEANGLSEETSIDPAQADDGEGNQEVDATDQASEPMTMGDFLVRGMLMAVLMRLPKAMRVRADSDMLGDMADFVSRFEHQEERMVAVELIRSIAETKPRELPGGQYRGRVAAAFDVVRGELDHIHNGVAPADDPKAAAARLAKITGNSGAPVPGAHLPSALDGATDEQKAAHARLYGDAAEGVRSADE